MRPSRERQSILVIDDDPTNLKIAVEHLRAYSYEILIAKDGIQGIERALRARPDLILLDVQMPGIDGYETCRRLVANPDTCAIPVLLLTALTSVDHRVRGFEAGAVDYVTKPVEARELLARVRAHLELRALRVALEVERTRLAERLEERAAYIEGERARRAADAAERERLLELVRSQGAALRACASADATVAGAPLAADERLRVHLDQARRLLGGPTSGLADEARAHILSALHLLTDTGPASPPEPPPEPSMPEPPGPGVDKLSERERQIVELLVRGLSNKEVAYELGVARTTVSTHRKRIFDKLGVGDLPALVRWALDHRLGA